MQTKTTSRRDLLSQSVLMMSAVAVGSQVLASEGEMPDNTPPSELAPLPDDLLVHLLNRISFGVRQQDLDLARRFGFRRYVQWQLDFESIDDSELETALRQNLSSLDDSATQLIRAAQAGDMEQGEAAIQLQIASLSRQAFSPRQLYERMVEFWSDHFSVQIQDGPVRFFKTIDDREVIRPNALGKFRDLLHANARSNAMLYYLDNFNNTRFGPNENYARELMELHTLGVDGGYTEADVLQVARSFTGWTFDQQNDFQFRFRPFLHDFSEKVVLETVIPAGGGEVDGSTVLDILASHPSTARFIGRKLAMRFVSETPPESLVDAVAETFMATDGDIAEVMRTLLFSEEFTEQSTAKLKRPIDYMTSLLRALGLGPDENLYRFLLSQLNSLGQSPFTWPAPNGFPDQSGFWANTNALITRWNAAIAVISRLSAEQISALMDQSNSPISNQANTAPAVLDALENSFIRQKLTDDEAAAVIRFAIDGQPADTRLPSDVLIEVARRMLIVLATTRYFQTR